MRKITHLETSHLSMGYPSVLATCSATSGEHAVFRHIRLAQLGYRFTAFFKSFFCSGTSNQRLVYIMLSTFYILVSFGSMSRHPKIETRGEVDSYDVAAFLFFAIACYFFCCVAVYIYLHKLRHR